MLPGLRFVIAGIFIAIIFPMIAFGIAGSFRSANGTSFNPVTAPAAGPALAEYYYSRLYAPSAAGTTVPLPAEAALTPTIMSDAAKAPEAPAPNEAPKIADQIGESPKIGDAPTIAEAPKPVETPEAAKSLEAGETDASKTLEISTPRDVPKPANERVARLPDAALEPSPQSERAAPTALPNDLTQGPAGSAAEPESAPPATPQSVAALAPAESAPPATTGALDHREASLLVGPIPLPPTRPAAKPSHRAAAVAQRSRPRGRAEDAPFIPLKNSLFESLFGGMGKI